MPYLPSQAPANLRDHDELRKWVEEELLRISRWSSEDALIASGRPLMTANRTYYVRTDGSDSNSGTANTAAGAFLTIQKAINVFLTLDLGGFTGYIQVGAGTYGAGFTLGSPLVGGLLHVNGDPTTPGNVIISPAAAQNCFYTINPSVQVFVSGFKFLTSAGGIACYASDGSQLNIDGSVEFGACSTHLSAARGGVLAITNGVTYTISGGGNYHVNMAGESRLINNLATITLTGTPNFIGAFANIISNSLLQVIGNTYVGAATGTRFTTNTGGGIDTAGAGAAYLPGNVAGAATAPGWYA